MDKCIFGIILCVLSGCASPQSPKEHIYYLFLDEKVYHCETLDIVHDSYLNCESVNK